MSPNSISNSSPRQSGVGKPNSRGYPVGRSGRFAQRTRSVLHPPYYSPPLPLEHSPQTVSEKEDLHGTLPPKRAESVTAHRSLNRKFSCPDVPTSEDPPDPPARSSSARPASSTIPAPRPEGHGREEAEVLDARPAPPRGVHAGPSYAGAPGAAVARRNSGGTASCPILDDAPEHLAWVAGLDDSMRTAWKQMVRESLDREMVKPAHWEVMLTGTGENRGNPRPRSSRSVSPWTSCFSPTASFWRTTSTTACSCWRCAV